MTPVSSARTTLGRTVGGLASTASTMAWASDGRGNW
jgi:hypothetical protein